MDCVRKIRVLLWLVIMTLVAAIFVLPAWDKYQSARSDLSTKAAARKVIVDSVDKTTERTPARPALRSAKLVSGPSGTEGQLLITAAAVLGLAVAASKLAANRRRANRRRKHDATMTFHVVARQDPLLWNKDIELMESIGTVGLLTAPAVARAIPPAVLPSSLPIRPRKRPATAVA
jgi:hypothetical protein